MVLKRMIYTIESNSLYRKGLLILSFLKSVMTLKLETDMVLIIRINDYKRIYADSMNQVVKE